MKALQKTGLTLSIVAMSAFGGQANAQGNDNLLAMNGGGTETTNAKAATPALTAPVIMEGIAHDAAKASLGENIALYVRGGVNDTISAQRYAKGLVNGFANNDLARGNAMYVTATYDQTFEGPSFVMIFIDGVQQEYKGRGSFTPQFAGRLIPLMTGRAVQQFGSDKVIPAGTSPALVSNL